MTSQGDATFGDALRAAVKSAGYTQARLAEELRIDAGQVSRWVNNKTVPPADAVDRIGQILRTDLSALSNPPDRHELYVSAPITALEHDRIGPHHDAVQKVVAATHTYVPSLYWPGRGIRDLRDLSAADIATSRNMKVLEHCSALLYLQFEEVVRPSSALIELGCALGRRVKTTAMIRKDLPQPFILQHLEVVAETISFLPKARIYPVSSADEACDLITKNGRELLGLR